MVGLSHLYQVYGVCCVWWICLSVASSQDPYFWHIADVHVDPTYWTSQQSCNELVPDPGRYGEYLCDAPYSLVRATADGMKAQGPEPTFILFTGDNPHHPKDRPTSGIDADFIVESLRNVTQIMNETFPDTPFVVALGNHDYYPKDQLPGENSPLYSRITEMWRPWIGEEGLDTFQKGAYYSIVLDPVLKIRAVVINTNLYLRGNGDTKDEADPGDQYTWLEGVLSGARINQEKIHIISHVPTGVRPLTSAPALRDTDNDRLVQIIGDYSDVIVGWFSCHEHLDVFRLVYSNKTDAVVPMFIVPSVSPWRRRTGQVTTGPAHNPAMRKIYYSGTTGKLTDLEQFFLDLPEANEDLVAKWESLYRLKSLYNLDDITAASLHELAERFKEEGSAQFETYYSMTSVGVDGEACDCGCKAVHVCAIQNMAYRDFQTCIEAAACDPQEVTTAGTTDGCSGLVFSVLMLVMAVFSNLL